MSKSMSEYLPCPSCGFLTCEENYGNYNICEVCGWEDDGVQLANPCSGDGANSESLAEAQEKSIKEYPLSVELAAGLKRSKNWRPLKTDEVEKYNEQKKREHWHNKAVLYESEAYWSQYS
jgi:hypothetical protein